MSGPSHRMETNRTGREEHNATFPNTQFNTLHTKKNYHGHGAEINAYIHEKQLFGILPLTLGNSQRVVTRVSQIIFQDPLTSHGTG